MTKTILILAIVAAFVAGSFISLPYVNAAPPANPGNPLNQILALLTDPIFGLAEIKSEVQNIETVVSGLDFSPLSRIETKTNHIDTEVTNINGKLDGTSSSFVSDIKTETDKIQIIKNNQYIPYHTLFDTNTVCATAGSTDFATVDIKSANNKPFTTNSIWILLNGLDEAGDVVRLNNLFVDSDTYQAFTIDATGSSSPVFRGFEVLGLPLQNQDSTLPRELSSNGLGGIRLFVFCDSGTTSSLDFRTINVSGWKLTDDSITVSVS